MSAIVAKVMNSTVGTSAVKALDTILKESDAANVEKLNTYMTTIANNAADRLYTKLKNDVRLVGSDEVIFRYDGEWRTGSNNKYMRTTQGVSFSHDGTVIAKTIQSNTGSDDVRISIEVKRDSADGVTIASSPDVVNVPDGAMEISVSFNVTKGTRYYIEVYESNSNPDTNVNFCGSLSQFGPTATMASS